MSTLLILTVLHLSQRVPALPIQTIDDRAIPSCNDLRNCRTVGNIVWSCIVTVFACTWVAVHPNIPSPNSNRSRWYSGPLLRARIMFYALIGPEFIIAWAWQQRYIASATPSSRLTDWSRTHGFFAAMGGFVLDGRVLSREDIERLAEADEIEYPIITKEQIKDRSKGNAITKGLVLIQTTWFLLQCVARKVQHLSLTELELVTAGFALLNVLTYSLWWDKPLNVHCPVTVQRKRARTNLEDLRTIENYYSGWRGRRGIFLRVFQPFGSMISGGENHDDTFFAGQNKLENHFRKTGLGTGAVSVIFGGTHCIGWFFSFPSHTEQLLWRISSIAMTVIPLVYVVGMSTSRQISYIRFVEFIVFLLQLLSVLYLLTRLVLLVLSFISLRSLSPSHLQTVYWTTFIPHV